MSKLNSCKTMDELNTFISEIYDVIVNKMRMDQSKVDGWKEHAKKQKDKLTQNGESKSPKYSVTSVKPSH